MKKLDERSQWENEWASAFDDASLKPSENVWHSIDGVLANKEAKKYKRRAFYFQWLAAASFFVAACSIMFVLLQQSPGQQQQLAERSVSGASDAQELAGQQSSASGAVVAEAPAGKGRIISGNSGIEEKGEDLPVAMPGAANTAVAGAQEYQEKKVAGSPTERIVVQQSRIAATAGFAAIGGGAEAQDADESFLLADQNLVQNTSSELRTVQGKGYMRQVYNAGEVTATFKKVWLASHMLSSKKEEEAPRYWLGANVASTHFNPNFEENNPSLTSMVNNEVRPGKGNNELSTANLRSWEEEQKDQLSINAGIQAASWIGKKWVLQGGVQYGNYRTATKAGTYVDNATAQAYPLHYANFSYDKLQTARAGSRMTAPVSAVNSFEFVSIPLRIGYMVFDKKVSLMVSPGISSEFFLRNQISDENNRLSTYTVYGGEDSPFNRVHLRGILGAQLFYKLGPQYMISLEPSYQQSITDFNKSGSVFRSRPSNLGIAAGFRYIIR